MERIGVDVSEHNGSIKWSEVKGNIDFAIIRAGYGLNNIDKMAVSNVQGCEANGIPYGLYWFSYAYTVDMAKKEAEYFIKFIGEHKPSYPVYFDFEYDSVKYAEKMGVTITKELLHSMATVFCDTLEKAGFYVGIYANTDYIKNKYNSEIFKKYDLWYAYWENECNRPVYMWQYTASGSVPGISGKVDMNKCYVDYPAIMVSKNLNGYTSNNSNNNNNENNSNERMCKCKCCRCPRTCCRVE